MYDLFLLNIINLIRLNAAASGSGKMMLVASLATAIACSIFIFRRYFAHGGWLSLLSQGVSGNWHHQAIAQIQPMPKARPKRIIIAMTGATGAILGIQLLEKLRDLNIETHLVISRWATETIRYETSYSIKDVRQLASHTYSPQDAAAKISGGSFHVDGMIVAPCSVRTLSVADDLILVLPM